MVGAMAPFPSSNRRVVVNPVNSAGPFPLDFPLFAGDGSDLDVRLDNIPVLDFTLAATIENGFYGAPNTWVNGSIMLPGPVTGELVIEGLREPRRQAQYAEGRGIPARDINTELNALTAVDQELRRDLSKALAPTEDLIAAVAAAQAAAGTATGAAGAAAGSAEAAGNAAQAAEEAAEEAAATMGDAIRHSPQTLTAAQQAQARSNISAGVATNFVQGLILANNVADATNDIDIGVGAAQLGSVYVASASVMTKRLDAAWSAGNNGGGLDTGSKANGATYYVHSLRKDSDGSFDAVYSLSATAPTVPAGYTKVERLGSLVVDGAGAIRPFIQTGNWFRYNTPLSALTADLTTSSNRAKSLLIVSLPTGLRVRGIFSVILAVGNADGGSTAIFADGDNASVEQARRLYISNAAKTLQTTVEEYTNTAARIYFQLTVTGASSSNSVTCLGWHDYQIPRIGA